MARRKRPRVVWLPPDRGNRVGVAPANTTSSTTSALLIVQTEFQGQIGDVRSTVTPIVLDEAPEDGLLLGTQSLADVTQSGYRLRRIVGKIFGSQRQASNGGNPAPTIGVLTVGFIVLRVNEEDSQPLQNAAQYNAASYGNNTDPWIWRRSWVLQNQEAVPDLASPAREFSGFRSTIDAGSVADGPHIDAKTARIIGPEERLFMVTTTTSLDGGAEPEIEAPVTIIADLRVLGSMRANVGNRRNASR